MAARLREERPRTLSENAAEYLALYRELAARGETPELDEAESAAFTRACMGFPRTRHTTPLGDGDYDEWLRNPRRPCVVPSPDVPAIHAVILPGAGENGESRTRASLASQSLAPSAVTAAPGGAVEAVRALNRAIAAAGEWIAFVQAGDTIETDALAAIAAGIAANPRAALIYCDDDAVSARGERYDPVFKPRFSPELLRHSPYIAGLCAVRAAALRDRGGLRAIGWSGVVDFALRLAEEHEPGAVVALRELLVHRHDANLGDLQDEAGAPEHLEIVRQHLKRGGARPLFMPAAPGAPPMWAHAPASTLPVTLFLRAAHAPERAAACLGELLQRSGHRIGEVFADLAPAQCNEVSAALAPMGIRVAVVPALDENRPALAYALRRARHEWVAVVDAQCANFRAGWLERLEQGVADRYTAAIAPDLQSPLGARVPGWEVLGAGPCAVCGAPAALRGASALDALYALPREVSVVSNRVALLRRASAIESGALDELSAAGRFDMAHLGLALGALGHDLLSRPFIAADYLGPSDAVQAARVFAGGAGVPEADWMRARWGSQLEDDKRFHPAIALGGERLAAAPGFPPRANMASRAPRICAFPFDRWGTGEIRVRQPCAALDRAGRASVRFMPEHDTGRAPNRLEWRRLDPDVLYAHNFLHDYQLFALEEYARHSKVLKVVGFDDLLTVLPEYNPYAATIYPDIAQRIARAVERSDRVIVTTAALAEAYGRGREVRIIPNAIDEARWAGLANRPRGGSRPRIGWAGARQHFGDLQLLEPVVKATCAEVDWVFFGMCPAALRAMAAEVHEMVPVSRYPGHLASLGLDVAVAPLLDIPFNRAKSNLKLLEYGILGIPVIASDVEPYRGSRAILVRPDPDSWADAVLALARDRDYARRVGMAMQEWVRQQGLLSQTLDDWSRALDPAG
ncbi:MAG: glycosyltransferase [Usitatibacter sp.]